MSEDIVKILNDSGYKTVEGADAVRQKIDEMYAKDVLNQFISKGEKYNVVLS